jgi:hypothetical protein
MNTFLKLLIALNLASLSEIASAEVIFFQNGRDGYLGTQTIQISSGLPNQTTIADEVGVDPISSSELLETQVLIRFDDIFGAGKIPTSGITVQKAGLFLVNTDYTPGPVDLYEMSSPWDSTTTWNSLGADGITGDVGSLVSSVTEIEEGGRAIFDVTSSVSNWLNGAPNYGWGLKNQSIYGLYFYTENYFIADFRPVLGIRYEVTTVPLPPAFGMFLSSLLGFVGLYRMRK